MSEKRTVNVAFHGTLESTLDDYEVVDGLRCISSLGGIDEIYVEKSPAYRNIRSPI